MTTTKNIGDISLSDLEMDFLKNTDENENIFPFDIFPKAIQEIILEANNKFQFSIDYLGSGILSAASTAIGLKYKLGVKEGWNEKCNLYVVIVGRPGDSKSHAIKFCFDPIQKRDSYNYKLYKTLLTEYENNSNIKEGGNSIKKPILKKNLVSDFTPEALIYIHHNNPDGVCIYVDELNGWLKNFNRYNNSGEAETYLSMWSGTTISLDRASGKSLRIDEPFIGVIGSTQIGVLKEFAREGRNSNGFMDRLLFVYPTNPKTLKWNIKKVDKRLLDNYTNIISCLLDLENEMEILPIELKAKEYLFEWQNSRPEDFLFDYERSIEIKLQQYVLRFALIIQLLFYACKEGAKKQIELQSIKAGIHLFEYYKANAIRVRVQTSESNYLESLTELQRNIYNELPKEFATSQGIKIACKLDKNDKPRVSDRQFKTYLNDRKLFKKISRGNYKKVL